MDQEPNSAGRDDRLRRRVTEWDPEVALQICDRVQSTGIPDEQAGRLCGVNAEVLARWKSEHPEFVVQLGRARDAFEEKALQAIRDAAAGADGRKPDWKAAEWLLQRQPPDVPWDEISSAPKVRIGRKPRKKK